MKTKTESGQVIVLLVFAIVGLIGFTALAIDGGMLFSDRRHAQSASDAASMAGGGFAALYMENNQIFYNDFKCESLKTNHPNLFSDVGTIGWATERAKSNNYTDDQITVTVDCEDNGPLFNQKYLDIATTIVKQTNTALIHFVYDGPAVNQVESTVRVRPRNPLAFGHAIVALNENCHTGGDGIVLGGSSRTIVNGGGIFSNDCLTCNGLKPSDYDGDGDVESQVEVIDGNIVYAGASAGCDAGDTDPAPQSVASALPASSYYVPTPNCGGSDAVSLASISSDLDINATYPGKTLVCLTSNKNAIKISSNTLNAQGVTFYLQASGDIEISGGLVTVSAPPTDTDPETISGIPGILFYVDPGSTSVIKLNGNSASSFYGVTYAPNADIEVNGTGDLADPTVYNTQLIGMNVEVTGNAFIDINFNSEENYSKPAWIDLYK